MASGVSNASEAGMAREWEASVPLTNPGKGHLVPSLLAVAISFVVAVLLWHFVPMR